MNHIAITSSFKNSVRYLHRVVQNVGKHVVPNQNVDAGRSRDSAACSRAQAVDVNRNVPAMRRHSAHGLLRDFFEIENDQHGVVVVGGHRVRRNMEAAAEVAQCLLVAHKVFSRSWPVRGRRELRRTDLDPTLRVFTLPRLGK